MTGRPLRLAVLGAGARGREAYGKWILNHPDRVQLIAVADPDVHRREGFAQAAGGAAGYTDWRDLICDLSHLAPDAVIVALPDRLHVEPVLTLLPHGVPILLEKPAAPTESELNRLAEAVATHRGRVVIGHVLRFTPFWSAVAAIVRSGTIGRLMTVEVRENIGFWHFAHSYVRGNWRRTADSSPMVLAKTCHDLDLIRWLVGEPPQSVSSVGELSWFRAENAPPGAPQFCVQGCPVSDSCAYYAPRYYVDALRDVTGVPVTLVTADTSPEGRMQALATSGYGRCVYHCDNDVVDHQQTVFQFPGGTTASLSTTAFTAENTRHLSITGTAGQILGHMDLGTIELDLFAPTATLPELLADVPTVERTRPPLHHRSWQLEVRAPGAEPGDHRGHAGGDDGLMEAFVTAVETDRWNQDLSFVTAMDSHRMAFAAERSRLLGEVVTWATTSEEVEL